MNGAESLVRTLADAGVDVCFSNPGTSEMHFVAALDSVAGIRPILGLFEGAVTGMADGYGRMARKPAATLLHLGPGLANGLANLHNARRAATPIVNIVGDHATYHAQYDAPLASDIAGFARPVSGWLYASTSAATVATDGARAVAASLSPPGQIATLILPADTAWDEAEGPAPPPAATLAGACVERSGRQGRARASLGPAGGPTDARRGAGRSRSHSGRPHRGGERRTSDVRHLRAPPRPRGRPRDGRADPLLRRADRRLPQFGRGADPGRVQAAGVLLRLSRQAQLVPAAGRAGLSPRSRPRGRRRRPGSAGPGPGRACPADRRRRLRPARFADGGLQPIHHRPGHRPPPPRGRDHFRRGRDLVGRHGPGHDHRGAARPSRPDRRFDRQGIPLATGAAVACPHRKVVCIQGDGGAMYTLQALWTQARERLDVVTVIFANRSYAILNVELARVGAGNPGPKALSMLDLHNPELDWVRLAGGMGVEASRAETITAFEAQFASAIAGRGHG